MSRINNNFNSLVSQRVLGQQNKALTQSLERLSTGLAINRGADNPAGLIASEKLRSEKTQITAALDNAERADQIVNIAEGGLGEVSSLLLDLQSLVSESANDAGLSDEAKEANQQQADQILQTIDRIASTTSFQGNKLLNGSYDFQVSGVSANVASFSVNAAKFAEGGSVTVKALVTASAQHAGLFLSAGGALNLSAADATFRFEVAGAKGAREFSFASGTTLADIKTSINAFKSITGVSAQTSGTGIVLKSTAYGSDQFVSVNVLDDAGQAGGIHLLSATNENRAKTAVNTTFANATAAIRDDGQDVTATINGIAARGKGKNISVSTDVLDVKIELSNAAAASASSITAFTVKGGGAKFNIGPNVDLSNQVRLSFGNVASSKLGNSTDGFLSDLGSGKTYNLISGDLQQSQTIVNNAIDQVSTLRGRLGSFQSKVIGASVRALGVALENTTAAESAIRDTDFAKETAALTRSQILVSAAGQSLSIANNQPQSVLRLLG